MSLNNQHKNAYCLPDEYVMTVLGTEHLDNKYQDWSIKFGEHTNETPIHNNYNEGIREQQTANQSQLKDDDEYVLAPHPESVLNPMINTNNIAVDTTHYANSSYSIGSLNHIHDMPSSNRTPNEHPCITADNRSVSSSNISEPQYVNTKDIARSNKCNKQIQQLSSISPHKMSPSLNNQVEYLNQASFNPSIVVRPTYDNMQIACESDSSCYNSPITPLYQEIDDLHTPTMSLMHSLYPRHFVDIQRRICKIRSFNNGDNLADIALNLFDKNPSKSENINHGNINPHNFIKISPDKRPKLMQLNYKSPDLGRTLSRDKLMSGMHDIT